MFNKDDRQGKITGQVLTTSVILWTMGRVKTSWGTKNHVCFDFVHLRLKKTGLINLKSW